MFANNELTVDQLRSFSLGPKREELLCSHLFIRTHQGRLCLLIFNGLRCAEHAREAPRTHHPNYAEKVRSAQGRSPLGAGTSVLCFRRTFLRNNRRHPSAFGFATRLIRFWSHTSARINSKPF